MTPKTKMPGELLRDIEAADRVIEECEKAMNKKRVKVNCPVCKWSPTAVAPGARFPVAGDVCLWCGRGRLVVSQPKIKPAAKI